MLVKTSITTEKYEIGIRNSVWWFLNGDLYLMITSEAV